jgi:hypothetical protein
MARSIAALLVCAFWPAAAMAQDQAIAVYFTPLQGAEFVRLNQALENALSQPPLQLAEKPGPHVLLISIPEKVEVTRKQAGGTHYNFAVAFSRDGAALGQSLQDCNANQLSDCTDQIVLDAKSAAAPR